MKIKQILLYITVLITVMVIPTYSQTPVKTTEVYGDAKEALKTLYNDGSKTAKTFLSEADSLVKAVAPEVQDGAQFLWDTLVKQQKVLAFVVLFMWLKAIILMVAALKMSKKAAKDESGDLKFSFKGMTAVVMWIAAICLFAYSTWNTNKMFTGFVNPEGGAIKNIYEMVIEYKQSKNPVP